MQPICKHIEYLIEIGNEELPIVRLIKLWRIVYMLEKGVEQLETSIGNVTVCVLETPYNCIDNIFLSCDSRKCLIRGGKK